MQVVHFSFLFPLILLLYDIENVVVYISFFPNKLCDGIILFLVERNSPVLVLVLGYFNLLMVLTKRWLFSIPRHDMVLGYPLDI